VSKERARRREEREREAAIRRAAHAAEQERRERQAARRQAMQRRRAKLGLGRVGRPGGSLARRRRSQHVVTLLILGGFVLLAFVLRPDWPARLVAVIVAVLAYPVLRTLLFRRV
jgi:Flp pilus assembly protein TadB